MNGVEGKFKNRILDKARRDAAPKALANLVATRQRMIGWYSLLWREKRN